MKRVFLSVMLLFLTTLLLSSCGKKDDVSPTAEQSEAVDWKTEGFAVSGDIEESQKYWVAEYIPWKHENVVIDPETEAFPSENHLLPRVYDGRIYSMNTVINPPYFQATRWILEIFDTGTMSSSVREISYEQLGEENTPRRCSLTGMDVINEDSFVFQWMELDTNSDNLYHQTVSRMIYVNPEGTHKTDLWDTYLEKEIARDDPQEFIAFPVGYCVCDGAGNTYQKAGLTKRGYTALYVTDRDGAILLEYKGTPEQVIEDPMRTEGGELIFPVYDRKEYCYYFMWPDTETGKMRKLGTIDESTQIRQLFCMQGNIIYYETSDGIVTWDIKSGNRTLAFNYRDNGIPDGYQTMLVLKEGQAPLLRLYRNEDEDWLAPLSEEPILNADAIRVADLVGSGTGSRQVSECASLVSRKDLNQTVIYERSKQDAETFRTQIMAELMAGKGPDVLYVSRSDMALLQDMGLLADLNGLISQETLNGLWPGVIRMGTLDGKLAGLPGNITTARGMAVARDTWSKDTWQLEDIIALMADGSLESALYYPGPQWYFAPYATAKWLIQDSLEDSFLIDWEKRESHFEDERFIRLLEMTKDRRDNPSDDTKSWFHGGKSIAFFTISSRDIYDFGVLADREGGNYVGFPTTGESGNYMESSGMLVVNINAQNKEGIGVYLSYFLGKDIQGICGTEIMADTTLSVCRFSTEEIEQSPEGEYLWRGEKLSVMEDGSTSLHRAIAFLESCVPAPAQHPELMTIISEELTVYYEGGNNARRTAEIIDSRIQLYLDEQN